MPYTTTTTEHGRQTIRVDLAAFARDLAAELGGKVYKDPKNEYPTECQYIQIGADRLSVRGSQYGRKPGTVTVYIDAPEVPQFDRDTYDKEARTESAHVAPDGRPLATIAKDIKRRVIEANANALAKIRANHAAKLKARSGIVDNMAKLRELCPAVEARRQNDTDLTASLHNRSGHYFFGRMEANGSISVDRIGSMSLEKFARIVAILNEGAED